MSARTPHQFAFDNLRLIREYWAGVCDGDAESIHQARIVTRRLRAALAIGDHNAGPRVKLCRNIGRMLGAVREVDVTQELLTALATRVPDASAAIAAVRRRVADDQQHARAKFVKELEDVKLRPLATLRDRRGPISAVLGKDWTPRIARAIDARRHALSTAADRTPAVYMPNRLHQVRIAMKKLRYTLEVAEADGMAVDSRVLRDLRKLQDLLGTIHDIGVARHVAQRTDLSGKEMAEEAKVLDAVLAADCTALHGKYLTRRDRVNAICEYCAHLAASYRGNWTRRIVTRALPAAGLAVLPLTAWRLREEKRMLRGVHNMNFS